MSQISAGAIIPNAINRYFILLKAKGIKINDVSLTKISK